jgi:hypothetical protein
MSPLLKNNAFSFVTLVIVVLSVFTNLFDGCKHKDTAATPKTDTVIRIVSQPVQTTPTIQPVIIEVKAPAQVPVKYIVAGLSGKEDSSELAKKYEALVEKYYKLVASHVDTTIYHNTIALKDSNGTEVGEVKLPQQVTENKLLPFQAQYKLRFPERTITVREPYLPRNMVFAGLGIGTGHMGYPTTYLSGAFKNKRDFIYQVDAGILTCAPYTKMYKASVLAPIRLRKQ